MIEASIKLWRVPRVAKKSSEQVICVFIIFGYYCKITSKSIEEELFHNMRVHYYVLDRSYVN